MIINSKGLGDDSDSVGDSVIPDNTYLILLGFVALFVGYVALEGVTRRTTYSVSRGRPTKARPKQSREVKEEQEYRLEVDITGNGNWVEQSSGSLAKMKKEAALVKQREGMKTRIS